MRILIIYDNTGLAAKFGDYLETVGHTPDFAAGGGHGLARTTRLDAVVLDLALPGLDGIDLCAALRREGPDVPVMMLTARDTLADRPGSVYWSGGVHAINHVPKNQQWCTHRDYSPF